MLYLCIYTRVCMRRYTQCISMFISECPWVYLCAHTHIHTHKLIHTPNCEMKEILLLLRTLGSPPPLPKPLTGSRSADGALGWRNLRLASTASSLRTVFCSAKHILQDLWLTLCLNSNDLFKNGKLNAVSPQEVFCFILWKGVLSLVEMYQITSGVKVSLIERGCSTGLWDWKTIYENLLEHFFHYCQTYGYNKVIESF